MTPQMSAKELAALSPFDQLAQIERLCVGQDAGPGVAGSAGWTGLAFKLAATQMVVALDQIAEIMGVPTLSNVPGTKPWVRGIANLRGTVMTVVDLPAFLGVRQRTDVLRSRLLVFAGDGWFTGLMVDEVLGMRSFGEFERAEATTIFDSALRPYVSGHFGSEDDRWWVFDPPQLLNDTRFLAASD